MLPSPLRLSVAQVMRMSHGGYPRSEQAYQSPTHAPETQKQKGDHEAAARRGWPVHCEVAWIAGNEIHAESDQEKDGSRQRACQEAEPSPNGDSANDQTDEKGDEQ